MMSAFFPVDAFSSGSDDDAGSDVDVTNFYEYCHDCDRSDSRGSIHSSRSLFQSPPSSSVSCCSAKSDGINFAHSSSASCCSDKSDDIFSNDCCDEAINLANFICCGNSCLNKITRDERELYGIIGK